MCLRRQQHTWGYGHRCDCGMYSRDEWNDTLPMRREGRIAELIAAEDAYHARIAAEQEAANERLIARWLEAAAQRNKARCEEDERYNQQRAAAARRRYKCGRPDVPLDIAKAMFAEFKRGTRHVEVDRASTLDGTFSLPSWVPFTPFSDMEISGEYVEM